MAVKVFASPFSSQVVARVKYNDLLDRWNGSNWSGGAPGRHLGITKLRDGRFVLIHGTQWDSESNYGVVVSDREALNAILTADREDLLEEKRFEPLKTLAEEILILEHEEKAPPASE